MIEFDVEGLVAGVKAQAARLGDSLGESALRSIGFVGADMFRDEAKRNALAHAKTGTIYRNIIVKRMEEESDGGTRQVYLVTVRKGKYGEGDAFYWRFVEDGHKFVPRNKRSGKGANWKAHRAAAELEYGTASAPAYPFMRPAYESKKAEAGAAMQARLLEIIKEVVG